MSLFDSDLDDYRDRANACRCGGDMPGHCPGPASCPMCAPEPEEDEAEDEE